MDKTKIYAITSILLLCSLTLLFPLFEPVDEITVHPNTLFSFQKSVHSPTMSFALAEIKSIEMNVSLIDLQSNSIKIIYANLDFEDSIKIEFDKPGIYLFELISEGINIVTIESEGIFLLPLIIIGIVFIANIVTYVLLKRKEEF